MSGFTYRYGSVGSIKSASHKIAIRIQFHIEIIVTGRNNYRLVLGHLSTVPFCTEVNCVVLFVADQQTVCCAVN